MRSLSLRHLWLLCHEHQRRQHSGLHPKDRHQPQQSLKNLPSSAYVCDKGPCSREFLPPPIPLSPPLSPPHFLFWGEKERGVREGELCYHSLGQAFL